MMSPAATSGRDFARRPADGAGVLREVTSMVKRSDAAARTRGAVLPALVGVALLAAGCALPGAAAQAPTPAAEMATAIPVEVATAETGVISQVLEYTGNLQPQRSVTLVPRVGGQIDSVQVKVGDAVKAGDPIAVIESDAYQLQLQQAKLGLEMARLTMAKAKQGTRPEQLRAARAAADIAHAALKDAKNPGESTRTIAAANLAQAEAAVRLAQYQYDKISWAGQAGMTAEGLQLQQATTAYEQAKAAYDLQTNPPTAALAALEGQVVQADLNLALAEKPVEQVDFDMADVGIKVAEAAVKQAQLQVDYATIRTPFDGLVSELYVYPGSMVGPTVPVASLISSELEAQVNVSEGQIGQISPGQNAALALAAFPGQSFPALVTSVAPAADSSTHTFVVKVTPADPKGLLRSGMYAKVSILSQEHPQALLVPRAAVTESGGQNTVTVVVDGRAEPRAVTTGLSDADRIEILSGVSVGDQVVVAGQTNLTAGAPVKVVED
jgi:HlyD family secretion protein